MIENMKKIIELKNRGALFIINHSGGKDSQTMTILLRKIIPANQIVVIHADLPGADWPGTWEHVTNTCQGLFMIKCVARKTFMIMVDWRKMWPSPTNRQCTSDLKRGPIEKIVRHYIRDNNLSGLVVNCMGIRAEESVMRGKGLDKKNFKQTRIPTTFIYDKRNSKAGRECYQWYPIFKLTTIEVFETIKSAGQEPHWAYSKGMKRLSCMFCIMASQEDLTTAAKLVPDVYKMYVEKERELNFTFAMPIKGVRKFLPEITGINI